MKRHKEIAKYEGEWDIFDTMRNNRRNSDFVVEEYEYTNLKHEVGSIMQVSENGEKFIAIVSNWYKIYQRWHLDKHQRTTKRIMFRLSDKGWEYFRNAIFEDSVG